MRRYWIVAAAVIFVIALQFWQGCGGNDHGSSRLTFTGNVANVIPSQAMRDRSRPRWLAALDSLVPEATAQSTCPARHVLACLTNGADTAACVRVRSDDCRFSVSVDLPGSDFTGSFGFVDDANDNGSVDQGERIAFLFTPLGSVCRGMVVTLDDVTIDFTNGFSTAASVEKDPDTCPTPTPGGPPTATPTSTPYRVGSSLNPPPSTMLAGLFGLGVAALLLPRRRANGR